MSYAVKNCEKCGSEFEVVGKFEFEHRKNCSRECQHPSSLREAVCKTCGQSYQRRPAHAERSNFCSKACLGKFNSLNLTGYTRRADREASEHPTVGQIMWAAGAYEGEGFADFSSGSTRVGMSQKDPWLLERLQTLFGGKIRPRRNGITHIDGRQYERNCYEWYLYGARARGFLLTIYGFLSPRRKEQVRRALAVDTNKEHYEPP